MSYLNKTEDGRIIMPTFPKLQQQIAAAQKEVDWVNNVVLPKIREHGLTKGKGLTGKLIFSAVEIREFMPDVPKGNLRFRNYMRFNGSAMSFSQKAFMSVYDKTEEGIERLNTIKEFEQLPEHLKKSCCIKR